MSTKKTGRIAVIGSNMVDLVTYVTRMPEKGETLEAPSFEMGHGGKGANQAVAAARLGASVLIRKDASVMQRRALSGLNPPRSSAVLRINASCRCCCW